MAEYKAGTTRTRDEAVKYRNRLIADADFRKLVADGNLDALDLLREIAVQIVGTDTNNPQSPPDAWGRSMSSEGRYIDNV